jgi:serine/threonine protein kinase
LYLKILQNDGLDEKEAFKYFNQVVKAIEFLHENNLIHRDIKPENILLDKKDKIKLCDFGSCTDIKNGFRETFCGTFEYMAPEMIKELPYNQGVDIWSLGILLYEMIHGFSPFSNKNEQNKSQKRDLSQIFKNILSNKLRFKDGLSDECKSLIKSNYIIIIIFYINKFSTNFLFYLNFRAIAS